MIEGDRDQLLTLEHFDSLSSTIGAEGSFVGVDAKPAVPTDVAGLDVGEKCR